MPAAGHWRWCLCSGRDAVPFAGVVCLMCCCHALKEESSLLLGAVFVSPVLLLCK